MTMHVIDSEHDMEQAIEYTIKLTKAIAGKKKLSFAFPSDGFSKIFLTNLAMAFMQEGIPLKNNLEVNIFIPGSGEDWEDDDFYDEDDDDDDLPFD
jgi:hypothetical protein